MNINNETGSWSGAWNFTVGILRSPTNNSLLITNNPDLVPLFRLYRLAGASDYRVQIVADTNFTSITHDSNLLGDVNTCSGATLTIGA